MAADSERAYVTGLKLLATRELAEAQLRERLARRHFEPDDVDVAVARLRAERALDDRRTAAAYARTEATVRGRGRLRVLRRLQCMGIAPDIAKAAVGDAFADCDEPTRIERLIERRLRPGERLQDRKVAARLHRYLLSQGFGASDIGVVMRRRQAAGTNDD
jgi:regulatory protein